MSVSAVNCHKGPDSPSVEFKELLENEKNNFRLVNTAVSFLGGVPAMINPADMSNTIPNEKVRPLSNKYILVCLFLGICTTHNHKMCWKCVKTSSCLHDINLFSGCRVLPVLPVHSSSGSAEWDQSCSRHTGCVEEIQIKERSAAVQGWFRYKGKKNPNHVWSQHKVRLHSIQWDVFCLSFLVCFIFFLWFYT